MISASEQATLAGNAPVVFDASAWEGVHPASGFAVHPSQDGLCLLGPVENGRVSRDAMGLVPVPVALASETAMLIPLVVESLRVWDLLQLEIGAAALVTRAQPWSPLLELVASWYGAIPVPLDDVERHETARDHDPVAALRSTLAQYPLVGVVELTGKSDVVDTVLEPLPSSSRVMFAGTQRDRLTIDYYVNVHRKGLHLHSTILSPSRLFTPAGRDLQRAERAARLLANPARARACSAAVAASPRQP